MDRIYYGNAYYPECWSESDIENDLQTMLDLGFNTVRIGEFAWAKMQPNENTIDLTLFRKVIDLCKKKSMYAIICTPTACPPIWLTEKEPNVLLTNRYNRKVQHGARRNTCFNNPVYLAACDKIVEALAKEFGNDDNVIGWQIDNELYIDHGGIGCICPDCKKEYSKFLQNKYSTIGNLNKQCHCSVWSISYERFYQVLPPCPDIWNHPSSETDWAFYQNDLIIRFIKRQRDIIKKYSDAPVSTDMMPQTGLSYDDVSKACDLIQFNHYNNSENLWMLGMWCNYIRTFKDRPFWITETSTCWNGGVYANYAREQNFLGANVMLPVASGAELTSFWLWKAHLGGHEMMHGSVLDSWNRPLHIVPEVKKLGLDLKILREYISHTSVQQSDIAIHYTHSAERIFASQSIIPEFDYQLALLHKIYHPLQQHHIPTDFIGASHSLNGYKILLSPFTACLDEYNLAEKALSFVEEGGIWIITPLTDIRTISGRKYENAPLGHIEDAAKIRIEFTLPKGNSYDIRCSNGKVYKTENCIYNAITPQTGCEAIAFFTHGYMKNYAAITKTSLGKGFIYVLGAIPEGAALVDFIFSLLPQKEKCVSASDNVFTIFRSGDYDLFIAIEIENKKGKVRLPFHCENILNNKKYNANAEICLHPYEHLFVKRISGEIKINKGI